MKKLLLIVTFAVFTMAVFAQTGIWGLAFNQSVEDARNVMKSNGFKLMEEKGTMITYTNASIRYLDKVTLYLALSGKNLESWTIYYKGVKDHAAQASILNELDKLHGDIRYFDREYGGWVWELENDMAIYATTLSEGEFIVRYTEYIYDDYEW
ncbi:MAG: hypothetical protein U1B83_06935 [Candidatus Cloacimonadaceae bacterium]|nr:hypothetical protein [Candidatus Cloacimonadaceae bacterium]